MKLYRNFQSESFPAQILSGSAGADGINLYSWTEVITDGVAGNWSGVTSPRFGIQNAREINNLPAASGYPFYARLHWEGGVSGKPFYSFSQWPGVAPSSTSISGAIFISGTTVPIPSSYSGYVAISGDPYPVAPGFSGSSYISGIQPWGTVPTAYSGATALSGLPPYGVILPWFSGAVSASGSIPWGGIILPWFSGYKQISGWIGGGLAASGWTTISGYLAGPVPGSLSGYVMISGYAIPTLSGYVMASGYPTPTISGFVSSRSTLIRYSGICVSGVVNVIAALSGSNGLHGNFSIINRDSVNTMTLYFDCISAFGALESGNAVVQTLSGMQVFDFDSAFGSINPPYTSATFAVLPNGNTPAYSAIASIQN